MRIIFVTVVRELLESGRVSPLGVPPITCDVRVAPTCMGKNILVLDYAQIYSR